jgi:CRISPR-associated protein Cst1
VIDDYSLYERHNPSIQGGIGMLKYIGHPLIDVGVAVVTAYADKTNPADVTEVDLAKIATYIEREYGKNPMKAFLSVIFPNSGFTQPAFDKQPEKRAAYAHAMLLGWRGETPSLDERCVFFDTPAISRVYRETIPLIGAESGYNFYAEGTSGLPVSGLALLAIQAFPLGGVKCSGRVLIMHAEDPELTYYFASQALRANQAYLSLAAQAAKYDDAKYPRTQIIERLVQAEVERQDRDVGSVTAYHLTNYGTNAAIDIHYLPLQITRFLSYATDATYRSAWQRLVNQAWEGNGAEPECDVFDLPARRNVLYEDLFALPQDARRFLRTYILRTPRMQKQRTKDDPRGTYSLLTQSDLVSWPLTTLFLKEVMNVDETRIEAIRAMADRLADYIEMQGDQRLFKTLLYGGNSGQDRQELFNRLIRADYEVVKQPKLLFTYDEFLAVFENSTSHYTWMLARDLLLIRIIERLHEHGKIEQIRDAVGTPPERKIEGDAE